METATKERPDFVTDEHLEYLDDLRDSGATNMYGASAYLQGAFDELKGRKESTACLKYWMETFSERHPK